MCSSKGFIRRMLPFFATFAVGLFIASFFVNIGGPRFRGRGGECRRQNERLRMENEELRNENLRLKNELENQHWQDLRGIAHEKWDVPEINDLPVPPPMPVAPKAKR